MFLIILYVLYGWSVLVLDYILLKFMLQFSIFYNWLLEKTTGVKAKGRSSAALSESLLEIKGA